MEKFENQNKVIPYIGEYKTVVNTQLGNHGAHVSMNITNSSRTITCCRKSDGWYNFGTWQIPTVVDQPRGVKPDGNLNLQSPSEFVAADLDCDEKCGRGTNFMYVHPSPDICQVL